MNNVIIIMHLSFCVLDLSNLNQESGFLVKTGQLAKSVIISGSRRDADTAFGEPDASSEEDEEMETVEVETKSGKGDGWFFFD